MQPFELDSKPTKAKREPGPNIGDPAPEPDTEVPVEIPSTLRVFVAGALDGLVVLAFGGLILWAEVVLTGSSFATAGSGWLDRLAEWLSLHGDKIVRAGVAAAIFAGVYSATWACRGGQTLGRKLTNTVLVRQNGKPFTPLLAAIRAVVALAATICGGIGLLWPLVDSYHRAWQDVCTGSVMIGRAHV